MSALPEVIVGPHNGRPWPVVVVGTGPEAVAVARDLAAVLVEYKDLAAAEAERRKEKRVAANKVARFGVTLDFEDAETFGEGVPS